MWVAIGIILGCIVIGALLLGISSGPKEPVEKHETTFMPQAASTTPVEDKTDVQKAAAADTRKEPARAHPAKDRKNHNAKTEGSKKYGRAYVVTEPGKTPRMLEPQ